MPGMNDENTAERSIRGARLEVVDSTEVGVTVMDSMEEEVVVVVDMDREGELFTSYFSTVVQNPDRCR